MMKVALLSETSKNLIWFARRTIVTEILFNIDSSKIGLKITFFKHFFVLYIISIESVHLRCYKRHILLWLSSCSTAILISRLSLSISKTISNILWTFLSLFQILQTFFWEKKWILFAEWEVYCYCFQTLVSLLCTYVEKIMKFLWK